jgi:hypothetical protein
MPQLIYNYGDWDFWELYNPPNTTYGRQKVTFDGPNKLILVNAGETELDFRTDVYSNWKEWLTTRDNAKYDEAVTVIGGDPLPGQRVLGTTFFLDNGWRMRTWEGNHELTVTGNVFTTEGDPIFVPTLEAWTITINLNTSTLVEALVPETNLNSTDIAAVVSSVWNNNIQGQNSALAILNSIVADIGSIPDNVWDEIIDATKNQTAREKLRRIATKTQDIALR